MQDFRTIEIKDVNKKISTFGKNDEKRQELLDSLVAVCVFHAIKDGQITPAINLVAAVRGKSKEQVVSYLTKFAPITYSEKKGLIYNKAKGKELKGEEKANEVFEELPCLDDEFPPTPKQFRDMPFMSAIKHILKRAEEVKKAGKSVVFATEDEQHLFNAMQQLASKA